jgi:methionyl aminopeptidase
MDKDASRITAMRTGGHKLGRVRQALVEFTRVGVTFAQIEAEAQRLIKEEAARPSFSTVKGYDWATCIMKNDELCHGIPTKEKIVETGDVITVDVGLIQDGYHLDTTTTFAVGKVSPAVEQFLGVGRQALLKSIQKVRPGASVYDVSRAMQKHVERHGYGAVYQLTGHGIGKELHMEPSIPCIAQNSDKRIILKPGQTIAVEIMYTMGDAYLVVDRDGWTYRTQDGSLGGMFEDTVLVTETGYEVLTKAGG